MIEKNREKNSVVVVIEGDLDATQVGSLRPELRKLVEDNFVKFTFDFAKSRFMCSAGLGALVEVYNSVSRVGGSVIVQNLNTQFETTAYRHETPSPLYHG